MNIDITEAVDKLNTVDPIGRPGDDLAKLAASGVTGETVIDKFQGHGNDRSRAFYYVNLSESKNKAYYNSMDLMVVKNFPDITIDGISTRSLEQRLVELSPSIRNQTVNPFGSQKQLDKKLDDLAADMHKLNVADKNAFGKFLLVFDVITVKPMAEDIRGAMNQLANKDLFKNWFKADYGFSLQEAYNLMAHPKQPRAVHKSVDTYNEKFVGWFVLDMSAEKEGKVKYPFLKYADDRNGVPGLPLNDLATKLATFNFVETQDEKMLKATVERMARGETIVLTPVNKGNYKEISGFAEPGKRTISLVDADGFVSHKQFKKINGQEHEQSAPAQAQRAAASVSSDFLNRVPAPQPSARPGGDGQNQGKKM